MAWKRQGGVCSVQGDRTDSKALGACCCWEDSSCILEPGPPGCPRSQDEAAASLAVPDVTGAQETPVSSTLWSLYLPP